MGFKSHSYIPTLYAPILMAALYSNTCLSEISNTDYEGQIKEYGDTVKIRLTPHLTIRDYDPDIPLISETPGKISLELKINKGKYYNFDAEYIEVKQSDIPFVVKFAAAAGIDMKVEIEKDVFADIYTDADALNAGDVAGKLSGNVNLGTAASPLLVTKSNIVSFIADQKLVLDEQNVQNADRFSIIPAWGENLLIQCDEFSAEKSGDAKSALRVGKIGDFSGFSIYKSNTLHTAATDDSTDGNAKQFDLIAGHKSALTFATQLLVEEEKIKDKDYFKDYYRGLNVFGYKVVRPVALVHSVWKRNG